MVSPLVSVKFYSGTGGGGGQKLTSESGKCFWGKKVKLSLEDGEGGKDEAHKGGLRERS